MQQNHCDTFLQGCEKIADTPRNAAKQLQNLFAMLHARMRASMHTYKTQTNVIKMQIQNANTDTDIQMGIQVHTQTEIEIEV